MAAGAGEAEININIAKIQNTLEQVGPIAAGVTEININILNNNSILFFVYPTLFSFSRHFVCFEFYSSSGESHRWIRGSLQYYLGEPHFFCDVYYSEKKNSTNFGFTHIIKQLMTFDFS